MTINVGKDKRCSGHGIEMYCLSSETLIYRTFECGCKCFDRSRSFVVEPVIFESLVDVKLQPGTSTNLAIPGWLSNKRSPSATL